MQSNPDNQDVEMGADVAQASHSRYEPGHSRRYTRGRGAGGGGGVRIAVGVGENGGAIGALTPAGSYVPLTPSANGLHRYNSGTGKMTGLLQILCGSVTAVMGLLALVLHSHDYFMDLPLWAGLLYLFGGVFGVSTGKQQTFMIGLYLLFSTVSSMMSSVVVVTEGHATFMEANNCECSIFQSSHMLYDATAALVSCLELLVTAVAMYHCLAGLGCCSTCQHPAPRESASGISHHPTLMDFSNIPLPPAPIYPVLPPDMPEKIPLE